MIDWITGKFRCSHNPQALMAGRSIKTRVVNGVEKLEYEVTHRMSVAGSHDANITIRSLTDRTIEVSGNPVKFLQGHNVFGTNDLIYLVAQLFDVLSNIPELEIHPTDVEYEMIQRGDYRLSRVDVNEHFYFLLNKLQNRGFVLLDHLQICVFVVLGCLKRELYTSSQLPDVSFQRFTTRATKSPQTKKGIDCQTNCYRYQNCLSMQKIAYALKLRYFRLS